MKRISESIYVDVSGAETEEEAFTMYRESKAMLHAGGFNLPKFNTNSELRKLIHQEENAGQSDPTSTPHSDETYFKMMLGGPQSIAAGEQKTRGVKWCVES